MCVNRSAKLLGIHVGCYNIQYVDACDYCAITLLYTEKATRVQYQGNVLHKRARSGCDWNAPSSSTVLYAR